MSPIDESTHIQLIESVNALLGVIESLQARTGHPSSYAEMHAIKRSRDPEQASRIQLRRAGILPPAPAGSKP